MLVNPHGRLYGRSHHQPQLQTRKRAPSALASRTMQPVSGFEPGPWMPESVLFNHSFLRTCLSPASKGFCLKQQRQKSGPADGPPGIDSTRVPSQQPWEVSLVTSPKLREVTLPTSGHTASRVFLTTKPFLFYSPGVRGPDVPTSHVGNGKVSVSETPAEQTANRTYPWPSALGLTGALGTAAHRWASALPKGTAAPRLPLAEPDGRAAQPGGRSSHFFTEVGRERLKKYSQSFEFKC